MTRSQELTAALQRYVDARLDHAVSSETVIMYADALAEVVMKARAGELA